jgi:hypothetical protein
MASDVDPWHFGRNPDPQIRTNLLSSSGAGKMPTKNKFYFIFRVILLYFLKLYLHQSSKIKSHEIKKPAVEINGFLLFDGRIRIRTNNEESGSGRSKTYGFRSATLRIGIYIL